MARSRKVKEEWSDDTDENEIDDSDEEVIYECDSSFISLLVP